MLTTDPTRLTTTTDFVLFPDDAEWDEVRQAFNLLHDQRPAAIALPRDEREVAASVHDVPEGGLTLTAQATGHDAGPPGSLDETMIVNTSRLTGVRIDATARRVRVGAGGSSPSVCGAATVCCGAASCARQRSCWTAPARTSSPGGCGPAEVYLPAFLGAVRLARGNVGGARELR